jgi:hypothetical protein
MPSHNGPSALTCIEDDSGEHVTVNNSLQLARTADGNVIRGEDHLKALSAELVLRNKSWLGVKVKQSVVPGDNDRKTKNRWNALTVTDDVPIKTGTPDYLLTVYGLRLIHKCFFKAATRVLELREECGITAGTALVSPPDIAGTPSDIVQQKLIDMLQDQTCDTDDLVELIHCSLASKKQQSVLVVLEVTKILMILRKVRRARAQRNVLLGYSPYS